MGLYRKQVTIEWLENKIKDCKIKRDIILSKMKDFKDKDNDEDDYYNKQAFGAKAEYYQGLIDAYENVLRY